MASQENDNRTSAPKPARTRKTSTAAPRRRRQGRPPLGDAGPDATRNALLDAATKLFARLGYEPVTTGAIAAEAGVTQSIVHYHFGSKQKIWEAAIDRLMAERIAFYENLAEKPGGMDPLTRLKLLTKGLVYANAHNPDFARVTVHEGSVPGDRMHWLVESYMKTAFDKFEGAIRDAMAAGAIREMPLRDVTLIIVFGASLIFTFSGMIERMYGTPLTDPEAATSYADSFIDIVFNGLKPDGAPGAAPLPFRVPGQTAQG